MIVIDGSYLEGVRIKAMGDGFEMTTAAYR